MLSAADTAVHLIAFSLRRITHLVIYVSYIHCLALLASCCYRSSHLNHSLEAMLKRELSHNKQFEANVHLLSLRRLPLCLQRYDHDQH